MIRLNQDAVLQPTHLSRTRRVQRSRFATAIVRVFLHAQLAANLFRYLQLNQFRRVLFNNQLTSLTPGVFDGLTSLQQL